MRSCAHTTQTFGWLWAVAVLLLGCATGPAPIASPQKTVERFAQALSEHRFEEAYALMSDDYRARVSLSAFKSALEANPDETATTADRLSRATGPAVERASVRYDDDEAQIELERDGEHWRITTNVVAFYDQTSPRGALRAFIRAMERKRYDVVLRLVPDADKEGVTAEGMQEAWSGDGREEAERLINNLKAHVDAPIEVVGDRATMPYGDRMRVQFICEDGNWKIEDPE